MHHLQKAVAEQENMLTTQLNRLRGGEVVERDPL